MNRRAVLLQSIIFGVQWGLMLFGFGVISRVIAPMTFLAYDSILVRYLEAGTKAIVGLLLSLTWLLIWDRQVRIYLYRKRLTLRGKGNPTATVITGVDENKLTYPQR